MKYILLVLAIVCAGLALMFHFSSESINDEQRLVSGAYSYATEAKNIKEECRQDFIDHINAGHIKQRRYSGGIVQGTYLSRPVVFDCKVGANIFVETNENNLPYQSKAILMSCVTHAQRNSYAGHAITFLGCYTDNKAEIQQLDVYYDQTWRQKTLTSNSWSDPVRTSDFYFRFFPSENSVDWMVNEFFNRSTVIYGQQLPTYYDQVQELKVRANELLNQRSEYWGYRDNLGLAAGGFFVVFMIARVRTRKRK